MPASRRQFITFVKCLQVELTNGVIFLKSAELAPLSFVEIHFGSTNDLPCDVEMSSWPFHLQMYLLSSVLLCLFMCRKVVLCLLKNS